jgi:hypothetical protein
MRRVSMYTMKYISTTTTMGLNQNLFAQIAQQKLGCNVQVQSQRSAATNNR